ncbi:MAG: type I pullulanase [Elusimicrobia bacterium GWA2_56_46]|nr:MAG: type I pullulanase [Elusimicrobia bacterium GWA2_56_46]OGR55350.1 MAG: type I pullulanase [Elusimicrobia bacterium GWC2_56_31]
MTANLYAQSEFTVHYNRLNGDYENWSLWIWNETDKKEGFEVVPAGIDGYGAIFKLNLKLFGLEGKTIGILPRLGNWEAKDGPERLLKKSSHGAVFLAEGDPAVYPAPPEVSTRIVSALLESENGIKVLFNRFVDLPYVSRQGFYAVNGENVFHPLKAAFPGGKTYGRAVILVFDSLGQMDYRALNAGRWRLHSRDMKPAALGLGGAVYGDYFKSDKEMGLRVADKKTFIRAFAPFASKVEALFYNAPAGQSRSGRQPPVSYALAWRENGLWETEIPEDLSGKYWKLRAVQGGKTFEGLDPYAPAVTAHDGLALVEAETTAVAPGPVFDPADTVLYEMHIRDFTIDGFSGVERKSKYLGLTETGTVHPEYREIKTGIDHLSELGVNAVHLMPFQDFENNESSPEYNWGYMPVNFNSPEGWYATGLYGGERVREAKAMIDALHKKGIKVIMDVVYNHTAETGGKAFNFDALAKDYYYRVKEDGSYWNGSGCGNEFKSESPMGRKFIIDSLLHWVNEYKVDGFRFDLMGLIDQETVFALVKRLKEAKPDILIYGEPWASGETPVKGVKKGTQRSKGFSVFNDNLRDALKGSVFKASEPGYVQAAVNREAVMRGIKGAIDEFTDSPLETLNYVSCHDNHTLWDRITLSAKDEPLENRVRMDKLAQAVVLTSQGIPFLHSGEEFLRTKKGEENSYNLPDGINKIDWTLKKSNNGVFAFYRDLIALRRAHPAFRMKTAQAVRDNLRFYEDLGLPVAAPDIAYVLKGAEAGDSWNRIVVLINPRKTAQKFVLPIGEYEKALDENGACAGGRKFSGFIDVPALSMTVLYR